MYGFAFIVAGITMDSFIKNLKTPVNNFIITMCGKKHTVYKPQATPVWRCGTNALALRRWIKKCWL